MKTSELLEGFARTDRGPNVDVYSRFDNAVKDAVWELLKSLKVKKSSCTITVWADSRFTRTGSWVLVRIPANLQGNKVHHDIDLMIKTLPKAILRVITPFFDRASINEKKTEVILGQEAYMMFDVDGPHHEDV